MKKLILRFQAFGSSLLVVLTLQAQDQPAERLDKPVEDAFTNILEKSSEAKPTKPKSRHRNYTDRLVIGDNVVLGEDDSVADLLVIGGNAEIHGKVRSDLVVIGGSATLGTNAEVRSDLVVIGGSVTMATNAEVRGDLVVIGGTLDAPAGTRVDGERVVVSSENALIPDFDWLQQPLDWRKFVMTATPFPYRFAWAWIIAGVFLLLFILASVLFPRPLDKCVQALELRPGASFVTGLLAFMLSVPLILFLIFSFVGIILVPVMVFGLMVAFFFGKVAVYRYAGEQVGRQFSVQILAKPLVALLVGVVLFYGLFMVPVLGFAVWLAIAPLALGAALLAFFRRFSTPARVPTPAEPQTPLPGPPPPLTQQPVSAMIALSSPFGYRVGFWYRFAATLIDLAIVITVLAMLEAKGPIFIVVWVAYHVGMWTWKGATIGGMALRMKVMRVDGQPVDFAVALVRAFSAFISAAALFVGFFWAGWTKERQSWHDRIAGTCVVKVNPALAPAF
jgi:uncharacterized RDD family membrane protein YckC/cytoskeletal protein CcmA (bactofilin family)